MAISQHPSTESSLRSTNTSDAPNAADRYALWFFAGTLVLAIIAVAWAMMGI